MKTYTKDQVIEKFNKMSNKSKVDILMKALDRAEAITDIPQYDLIIPVMGFTERTDKLGYFETSKLNTEWSEDELRKIESCKNNIRKL